MLIAGRDIRVADRVLNRHFGGTYTAYLVLQSDENTFKEPAMLSYVEKLQRHLEKTGVDLPEAGRPTPV